MIDITIPNLKIVSEANNAQHWTKKNKRKKIIRGLVSVYLKAQECHLKPPCCVEITRVAPRSLDEIDNLPAALKCVIDTVADFLVPGLQPGRADGDKRIKWELKQEKGKPKETSLRIKIIPSPPEFPDN